MTKVIQLSQSGNYDAFEKIRASINQIDNEQQCNSTETWIELYSMLYQDESRTSKLKSLLNNKKLYV